MYNLNINKSTFALLLCNRNLLPSPLHLKARKEWELLLNENGYGMLSMEPDAICNSSVTTKGEGILFNNFLKENYDKFDGVIVSLPNYGNESGTLEALKDVDKPILIQAYEDDLGPVRRSSFCGKLTVMNILWQHGIPFTTLQPHTLNPTKPEIVNHLIFFDSVCQVVSSLKKLTVGAIGARTTPFKSVRIDEITLQRHGIAVETFDLSEIFNRIEAINKNDHSFQLKAKTLNNYSDWQLVPDESFDKLAKLSIVIDNIIEENGLDAIAIRCWVEFQKKYGISPCVLLSDLNCRGIAASCEVDIGSAVMMTALNKASKNASACLDWHNNYYEYLNKCILFHCGPVPQSMMTDKGLVTDHESLKHAVGEGNSYGCNVGRIAPHNITFGSIITEDGIIKSYLGEGKFTDDVIPADYFGCAGVAMIDNLQNILQTIGNIGFRHHVNVTKGHFKEPLKEAFEKYLKYQVTLF